jgi:hypothetical protein
MPISRGPSNTRPIPIRQVDVEGGPVSVTGPLTDAELRASAVPVSGPLTDAQLRATPVPVSGTVTAITGGLTDTQLRATPVPVSGIVNATRPATATTSQVADNAASVTLLASNGGRLGGSIANDSSAPLYVKLGATASLTDYTVRIPRNAFYELPFPVYTGQIDGIWASDPNDGAARITELTA